AGLVVLPIIDRLFELPSPSPNGLRADSSVMGYPGDLASAGHYVGNSANGKKIMIGTLPRRAKFYAKCPASVMMDETRSRPDGHAHFSRRHHNHRDRGGPGPAEAADGCGRGLRRPQLARSG